MDSFANISDMSNPDLRIFPEPQPNERTPIRYKKATMDYGATALDSKELRDIEMERQEQLHTHIEQLPSLLVLESGNEILIRPNSKHKAFLDYSVDVNSRRNWFTRGSTVIGSQLSLTRKPDLRIIKINIDPQLLTISLESNGDIKIVQNKANPNAQEIARIKQIFSAIDNGFTDLGFKLGDANTATSAEEDLEEKVG